MRRKNASSVVVLQGAGNHSNRLFQAIHLEAFCIEHGLGFANPSFHDMAYLYGIESSPADDLICFASKVAKKLGLFQPISLDDFSHNDEYYQRLLSPGIHAVQGWCFRAEELTIRHRAALAAKYSLLPALAIDRAVISKMEDQRRRGRAIVGLHIRRGDYRDWNDGRYLYGDAVYLRAISEMERLLKVDGHRIVTFVIFSNESHGLAEDERTIVSHEPWYIDHLAMSHCDYLIGPPSTFTLWASYIGQVPYFHIQEPSESFTLNDFKVCKG